MFKNISLVLIVLVFFASFSLAKNAPKPFNVLPETADMEKFPFMQDKELTPILAYELGLSPHLLDKPVVVLNHYRKDGSWRLQSLQAGDMVYLDKNGVMRYRADCSNRIELAEPTCTVCHIASLQSTPATGTMRAVVPSSDSKAAAKETKKAPVTSPFGDSFSKAWDMTTSMLGSLAGVILPLLILAALGGLVWFLLRNVEWGRRPVSTPTTSPSVAPVTPPATRLTTAPAVPPTAQPVPPTTPVHPAAPPATPTASAGGEGRGISFTEETASAPFRIQTKGGLRLVGYEEGEDGGTTIRFRRS